MGCCPVLAAGGLGTLRRLGFLDHVRFGDLRRWPVRVHSCSDRFRHPCPDRGSWWFAWRVSRAALLYRAGATALKRGNEDPHGKAGLKIVKELTSENEPWYLAILPWRKSDGGSR